MADHEPRDRNDDFQGLSGRKARNMIFSEEDYDPQELQPMRKKQHFDDDRRDIPTVRSSIPEIDGELRIFVGKGDRVVVKIDKEMPGVEIAARNIKLEPNTKAMVINSGIGAMGVVLAALNRDTDLYLHDANVSNAALSRRNIETNYGVTKKARVIENFMPEQSMDSVIYDISSGYNALQTISDNVLLAKKLLKVGGRLYCITYTRAGAPRHEEIMKGVFGDSNVTTVAKGNGGFRVFEAIKEINDSSTPEGSISKVIDFSVLGRDFSLVTEPGLFSKDGLDSGTRLLIETAPLENFDRLLDFGCGWGAIGVVAGVVNPNGNITMVDVNTRAVEVAKKNVQRTGLENRAKAVATDDVRIVDGNFDLVLSNPPFHADTGSLIEMFKRIKKVMRRDAKMYIVVEKSYLGKFEGVLSEVFSHHYIINQNANYYILGV